MRNLLLQLFVLVALWIVGTRILDAYQFGTIEQIVVMGAVGVVWGLIAGKSQEPKSKGLGLDPKSHIEHQQRG